MRFKIVLAAAVAALLGLTTAVPANAADTNADSPNVAYNEVLSVQQARQLIFNETNAARASKGLPALKQSSGLTDLAQGWSQQQARADRMYHNPNYASGSPAGWFWLAENVAAGYNYTDVVDAWLRSPGHYRNIMNANATHIGIGIAYSATRGTAYFTQNFGGYSSSPDSGIDDVVVTPSTVKVSRLWGADRYETARRILSQFPKSDTLYVASGQVFADALSAAAIAGRSGDPVVITPSQGLTDNLIHSIWKRSPKRIIIMGGTGAVSENVVNQLRRYLPNTEYIRMAGADRYATSMMAVEKLWQGKLEHAYLAVGSNYPDALAAAPAAIKQGATVIPVRGAKPDAQLLSLLQKKGVKQITLVGSTGVIPSSFEQSLRSKGFSVTRLGGQDRYATAEAIAKKVFPGAQEKAFIATGSNFADALAAAPLAGKTKSPLLLSRTTCLPAGTSAYLKSSTTRQVVLLGGSGVLTNAIERHLASC
ncbi:cell wall-binding repeat-containing protein [Microbacterium sp. A94]|uniref:cell wall-binding repeat-containing protein n=1 Tax=Microbacterium sp. A94 TaxID=3450717 RepID=UPI003F429471